MLGEPVAGDGEEHLERGDNDLFLAIVTVVGGLGVARGVWLLLGNLQLERGCCKSYLPPNQLHLSIHISVIDGVVHSITRIPSIIFNNIRLLPSHPYGISTGVPVRLRKKKETSLLGKKKLLHRSNVHAVVKEFCAKSVPWGSVFCPSHQDSNSCDQILNKVVTQLINLKCQNINQHIKDGDSGRTRQALSYTNNHGLYQYEEESELCSHDLQLLTGAQAQVIGCAECCLCWRSFGFGLIEGIHKASEFHKSLLFISPCMNSAAPTLEVLTSVPSTPTGKPATPFKMSTPHQGSTPQVSQLSGTPQLPQQRIPPVLLTPRQEARVKVRAAWQEGSTPTTDRAEQVTPKQIINNIRQSYNDHQARDDSSVLQLISLNKIIVPVPAELHGVSRASRCAAAVTRCDLVRAEARPRPVPLLPVPVLQSPAP
ncbi:LexA repressor [Frankliniella fusca]|uniref:LexA repressor n=1 Tax=Frankliniella fusca TaxID=407009 RepID=A0AAE1H4A4_9NEOP|nr:LexA repressor [Frankliniella fusca]